MQGQTVLNFPVALHKQPLAPFIPSSSLVRGQPKTARTHKRFVKQRVQLRRSCQQLNASSQPDTFAAAAPALSDAPLQQLCEEQTALPTAAGVYAVYDKDQTLQYVGLSRKVSPPNLFVDT